MQGCLALAYLTRGGSVPLMRYVAQSQLPEQRRPLIQFFESVECLVVGAGVIGLAVARAGREVIVVESESELVRASAHATAKSSTPASIIPRGLDQTRFSVDGKAMLYAFCPEFRVPHKRCGKFLVAVNAGEVDKLAALKARPRLTAPPISPG